MKNKSFWQFMKYCVVGLSNTLVNQLIYTILVYFRCNYLIASLIGFSVGVLNAFYWSNKYVFKEEEGVEKRVWWKVLLKTYAAYSWGFLVNSLLLVLWVDIVVLSEYLDGVALIFADLGMEKFDAVFLGDVCASLLNVIVVIPMNFVLNKYWAYKDKKVEEKV